MKTTTLIKPRPVREEIEDLSRTIRAERERGKARDGDRAGDCDHYDAMMTTTYGHCHATPLDAGVHPSSSCPQTCPCFRRRL
jgi:hypothetical protein